MKWFKHDSDANADAKLQHLMIDYGLEGYGLYWYCVELIANKVSAKNITFELEHDAKIIAKNTGISQVKVEEIMHYMVNLGLFDMTINNKIACIKLAYRLDDSVRKGAETQKIVDNFNENNKLNLVGKIPNDSGKVRLDIDIDIDKELDIERKKEKKKTPAAMLASYGVDGQLAKDFMTLRKTKRAAITETALKGIDQEAKKAGISMVEAVTICIKRNWQGFNASWDWKGDGQTKKGLSDESIRSLDFLDDVK